jgi:hypothetical protein
VGDRAQRASGARYCAFSPSAKSGAPGHELLRRRELAIGFAHRRRGRRSARRRPRRTARRREAATSAPPREARRRSARSRRARQMPFASANAVAHAAASSPLPSRATTSSAAPLRGGSASGAAGGARPAARRDARPRRGSRRRSRRGRSGRRGIPARPPRAASWNPFPSERRGVGEPASAATHARNATAIGCATAPRSRRASATVTSAPHAHGRVRRRNADQQLGQRRVRSHREETSSVRDRQRPS